MENIRINKQLIWRNEDRAVFDPDDFLVHKFNPSGFDLLMKLAADDHPFDLLRQNAIAEGWSKTQVDTFIDECLEARILIEF